MKWILLVLLIIPAQVFSASNYYTAEDVIDYTTPSLSVGDTYTEPTTGSTVTRRTDITSLTPDLPPDAMVVYSRFSPVNSSGEYALVHGTDSTSAWVLRLSDNTIIHKLIDGDSVEIGELSEIRWDYSGSYPNRVYFVGAVTNANPMAFYYMDAINGNGSPTLIHDFSTEYPSGAKLMNDVEGDSSNDSRYWAWQIRGAYNGSYYPLLNIITYDMQTDTILGDLGVGDVAATQNASSWTAEMPRPNMVEISPDGLKIITHYGRSYTGSPTGDFDGTYFDGPFAWNLDFSGVPTQVSIDETHSGWAWDSSGNPLFVSQQNRTDTFEACRIDTQDYPDSCVVFFDHAAVGYAGVHFAQMPPSKPGYTLASFYVNAPDEWIAETAYAFPSKIKRGDYIYRASSGTSGTTEPTWPTTKGDTVTDGTITWLNYGYAWAQNSIVMMEIDAIANNPTNWRVSPGYNDYQGNYRDEGSAAISQDGLSVWWTGNLDDSVSGHGEVLSVDLPSDWLSVLSGVSDTTAPIVTAFTLPATYTSLTVPISSFTCSDDTAVTGYCVSLTDSSSGCTWSGSAPSTVSFGGAGSQTAYAFCRDAALNVSDSVSDTVAITTSTGGSLFSGSITGSFQ